MRETGIPRWFTGLDGSVCVRCAGNEPRLAVDLLFEEVIVPAWRLASEILPLLGANGPKHLRIQILDGVELYGDRGMPLDWHGAMIGRWLDVLPPAEDVTASVKREVLRAGGQAAWEP